MRWLQRYRSPGPGPCQDFAEAERFKTDMTLVDGVDYRWVCSYGEKNFERLMKFFKDVDDKADGIFRWSGAGSGLLTLGAVAFASQNPTNASGWMLLALLPSYICGLAAVALALAARWPASTFWPGIDHAFEYAGYHKEKAEALFIGQMHMATEGTRLTIKKKAARVEAAHVAFLAGLGLLLVPITAAIIRAFMS